MQVSLAGERYALLVGVQKYSSVSGLNSLRFPENDIEGVAEVLLDTGYQKDHLVVLTQKRGAVDPRFQPTKKNIQIELSLLLRSCQSDDSVLIAFAGHGVQFKNSTDAFFCPMDTDLTDRKSLLSLTSMYQDLKHCKAKFKFLAVDACRNDPFQAQTNRSFDLKSRTAPQALQLPGGTAAFFSCATGQEARESTSLNHGVFFHFFIEGFKGAADLSKDRQITLPELEEYVTKRVVNHVRNEFRSLQTPQLIKTTTGSFPLTIKSTLSLLIPNQRI